MKIQFTFAMLAALLFSCHSTSQTSGTVQATPKYTFKKAEMPSISPCVQCVMTSAKKKYRRGSLSLPACVSGNTDKRYLKLSLSNGNTEQKLVVYRDCLSNLTVAGIAMCPSSSACVLGPTISDKQSITCQGQAVLTLKLKSSSVEVTLVSGWELYYETDICPQ